MSNNAKYISVPNLAKLCGITNRAIERAINRTLLDASSWRGAHLEVRVVHGQGGKGGKQYEVRVNSLPNELRLAFEARSMTVPACLENGSKSISRSQDAHTISKWRFHIIEPLLGFSDHSRERGDLLKNITEKEHFNPVTGEVVKLSRITVYRWISNYKREGISGLTPHYRDDKGKERVLISRNWDNFVPFDEETKINISESLKRYIRSLVKEGVKLKIARLMTARKLQELTIEHGLDVSHDILINVCAIPQHLILNEYPKFRQLHKYEHDRKAYEDTKQRVTREREGMKPLDLIVGDVHPIDICIRREDDPKSILYPKGIGWQDAATNRLWFDVVFLEKGEGIRNEHIIDSFIRMVRAWGMPKGLYLDNGSEYNFADFIKDAVHLNIPIRNGTELTHANGYSPQSKPIEGIFGVLEKSFFSMIPGWTGGDRMRKKSANHGKEPDPFPGSYSDLSEAIANMVKLYEQTPQEGTLKGVSPIRSWNQFIEQGWKNVTVDDENSLRLAFSIEKTAKVRNGVIQYQNSRYISDILPQYEGQTVIIRVPKYQHWQNILLMDKNGNIISLLEPDQPYHFLDRDGAREAARRSNLSKQHMKELKKQTDDIDLLEETKKLTDFGEQERKPEASVRILPSDDAIELKKVLKNNQLSKREKQDREQEQIRRENEKHALISQQMLKNLKVG